MSAGNSADKPQFVKNQMLTHDSLNNLVEFSAGRTKRVMKALGLGGTVSGVSWRYDELSKSIIVTPGFIIFPDGEVVEITDERTFKGIDENGELADGGNSITTRPEQLQVSYAWKPNSNKTTNKCFQTDEQSQAMRLTWKASYETKNGGDYPELPKPLSFLCEEVTKDTFYNTLREAFNNNITLFNNFISSSQTNLFKPIQLENITLGQNQPGMGILGDIAFEIAYFSRRLASACKCLSNIDRPTAPANDDLQRVTLNNRGHITPSFLDYSLRSEIALCHKVMADSVLDAITQWNSSKFSNVLCSAQGVYARVGMDAISGVFLTKTAEILLSACDAIQTYPKAAFLHLDTVSSWRTDVFVTKSYINAFPQNTTPCSISSFAFIQDGSKPILKTDQNGQLFFLKPSREW